MSSTLKYCNTECESECEQDPVCNEECVQYCLDNNGNSGFLSGWKLFACICVVFLLIGSCLYCLFMMKSPTPPNSMYPNQMYPNQMSPLSPMPPMPSFNPHTVVNASAPPIGFRATGWEQYPQYYPHQ